MAKTIHSILTFVIVLLGLLTSPIVASQTARVCVFPSVMAEDGVCYQSVGAQPVTVKILKKGIVERVKPDCVSIRETSWSLYETTTCTWNQTITGSDEGNPPLVGAGGSETVVKVMVGRVLILIGLFFMSISLLSSLLGNNAKLTAWTAFLSAVFTLLITLTQPSELVFGSALISMTIALTVSASFNYKNNFVNGKIEKTAFFSFSALYLLMAPVTYWLM